MARPGHRTFARAGGSGDGGSGVVFTDGVTIDGLGTPLSPISSLGPRAWTRIDVVANAQDIDIPIVGETAYSVEIHAVGLNNNAAVSKYTLQPNNLTTNQLYTDIEGLITGAPQTSVFNDATLAIGFAPVAAGASPGVCIMDFRFFMKAGTLRTGKGSWTQLSNAGVVGATAHQTLIWTDTATAITSLRLHSNQVDGWKAGSHVLWRAIPLQP